MLVGMLSQTGFKVMQKCNFLPALIFFKQKKNIQILPSGMRWQPHRLICEEISHCYSWKPVSIVG